MLTLRSSFFIFSLLFTASQISGMNFARRVLKNFKPVKPARVLLASSIFTLKNEQKKCILCTNVSPLDKEVAEHISYRNIYYTGLNDTKTRNYLIALVCANKLDSWQKTRCLHSSIIWEDLVMTHFLLDNGAEPNSSTLDIALKHGDYELIKRLTEVLNPKEELTKLKDKRIAQLVLSYYSKHLNK